MMSVRTKECRCLLDTIIHTFGYAALIDYGDAAGGITRASERVTKISRGSRQDADMHITISKTKTLHVRVQDPITSKDHL